MNDLAIKRLSKRQRVQLIWSSLGVSPELVAYCQHHRTNRVREFLHAFDRQVQCRDGFDLVRLKGLSDGVEFERKWRLL